MESQQLPYRPKHKLIVAFEAGGTKYQVVDTDYPIVNNEKLFPQLPALCSKYSNVPVEDILSIKVLEYKRFPKVRLPDFQHRKPRKGEYWLCGIDGFDHPRVFRREAGGWQVGNEVSELFIGRREIKPLSRLYTQREVYDVNMLYKLSQRTIKQLKDKLARIEKKYGEKESRQSITERFFAWFCRLGLGSFGVTK